MIRISNVLLLSNDEQPLIWLDPEKLEINVVEEKDKLKTISLEYPLSSESARYFKLGNKIWMPKSQGINSCLYIINSKYKLDYWANNVVTVDAEEVLVELNNVDLFTQTDTKTVTVNRARLEEWFGDYFNIGTVEPCLNSNLAVISTAGTMTKMMLLRFIEKETSNVFCTRYEKNENNNTIHRYLDFLQPQNAGKQINEVLDLNYNMDNIEYEVDESDTYRAIAPILSLSKGDDSTTSNSSMSREDLAKVISDWKQLTVTKGEVIPMIVEKKTETVDNVQVESIVYTAYWSAPFNKEAGKMYIIDDIDTDVEYNLIRNKPDSSTINLIEKIGTVSTSDTDKYAIFNDCAMKLIEKRYPELTLNASIKDLQNFNIDEDLNVHDNLYIKIPSFEYLLNASIIKTDKNPNLRGENKVSLSNANIGTKIIQKETIINSESITMKHGQERYIEAILSSEGVPVEGRICSILIEKPETTTDTKMDTSSSITKNWSQYGVSSDGTKIMAIGRPSAPGELKKYGYKFYKSVFKRKCAFCGSTELYWSIFWAGNETNNWGVFPATGKKEGGSAEGHIFCKSCDADFSVIDGKDHMSPPRATLTRISGPDSSSKTEAYNLKKGEMNESTSTVVSTNNSTVTNKGVSTIYNKVTDDLGEIKLKINLDKGDYNVKITFGGDIEYGRSGKIVKLKIE